MQPLNTRNLLLLLSIAMLACRDDRPMATQPRSLPSPEANKSVSQGGDPDRKDTHWQRMTDQEFAAAVSSRGGRVIIGLKEPGMAEGVDNSGRALTTLTRVATGLASLRAQGVRVLYEFKRTPVVVAELSPRLAVALRRSVWVDYMEPDAPMQLASQVTLWGVTKVNAPGAWPVSTGSGVKLLILDTGVTHSDLNVSTAWRCMSGDYVDTDGHGTHVAGIAAALNNSIDVVGAAYGVTLWSADVTVPNTSSPTRISPAEVACSIEVARANGVGVVNMSFGSESTFTSVTDQINGGYIYQNMVFVAAAGNQYSAPVLFPAKLSNVIAVTATDINNVKADFANVGSQLDLAAPGVAILSTSIASGYNCSTGGSTSLCSGTSMATPHVSAAAAILRSRYPSWSNSDIKNRLVATATDLGASGFDNTFGNGLVNIARAVGMTAGVGGPALVYSGYSATWTSGVSGGQTPYAYQWYINGSPAGTGTSLNHTASGSAFWVKLQVTDYYSLVAKDSLYVTVSSCTPPVIIC